ncbi:MAG: RHS repeat-associated core domain-containing protein [Candidatus Sulfotelmatobacter sp.]
MLSAFAPWCAEACISAFESEGKKPHQGVAGKNPALYPGITWSNSTTALGLRVLAVENRVGSRCTGKERDSESGLDNFGFRYYGSTMGRWMSPDLVNVTEDRVVNPANTLNKYVYGGNNPLKYIDPDGRDITYFYDPGGVAGHAVLYAYNQASGDFAIESFGPKVSAPVWKGESNFDMDEFSSAQGLRDNYASLTIQTTPELAQQVIDYIRANPDPSVWSFTGPNCSSEVAKILKQFKLDNQSKWDIRQGLTPKILWHSLMSRYDPSQNHWGSTPNRGQDYGNPRFDMFNLLWFSLPQAEPKATVTTTSTNCVTDENGKKTCDTQ